MKIVNEKKDGDVTLTIVRDGTGKQYGDTETSKDAVPFSSRG